MKLIIVNYSMNPKSVIFSHQRDTVLALANYFEAIDVFTCESYHEVLPHNVKVTKIVWDKNSPLKNVFRVLKTLYPSLIRNKRATLFSHMTDAHSALISPLTWALRIRHVLWYAHAHNSFYLIWSSLFVSKIISSTKGSCNLRVNRRKVKYINQGIDQKVFSYGSRKSKKSSRILYYGRLDESKNIHLFSDLIDELNKKGNFTLDIFGKSSEVKSQGYLLSVQTKVAASSSKKEISFHGAIERRNISKIAGQYCYFLNLFDGSLDKTLIEASLMRLAVVTWNSEYCSLFGTWNGGPVKKTLNFIHDEFQAIQLMPLLAFQEEIQRRYDIAIHDHSFDGWINRLVIELKSDESL